MVLTDLYVQVACMSSNLSIGRNHHLGDAHKVNGPTSEREASGSSLEEGEVNGPN